MVRLLYAIEDIGLDKLSYKDLGLLGIVMSFCGYLIIRVMPARDAANAKALEDKEKAHAAAIAEKDKEARAAQTEFLQALERRDNRFNSILDAKDKLLAQQWQDRNEGDARWRNALSDTVKTLSDSISKSCKSRQQENGQ